VSRSDNKSERRESKSVSPPKEDSVPRVVICAGVMGGRMAVEDRDKDET
jgi:hypothetical protein